jgi:DNA repair photolyase
LLRAELSKPSWTPQVIAMSGATDCYQPAERRFGITRACLEVLADLRNPVGMITKNALVLRDVDLLARLAAFRAVSVTLSITSLDPDLARAMEPRASAPAARLRAIAGLAAAGVPVGVNIAPLIPGLTDHEMPAILQAAAAGASFASYQIVRLPLGVEALFEAWLTEHRPNHAATVMRRVCDLQGGTTNSPRFGERHRGQGVWAGEIEQFFRLARRKAGLDEHWPQLDASHFLPPQGRQETLF